MMLTHKILFTTVASLGFVSCQFIDADINAAQLLMGRDASELYLAYKEPKKVDGDLNNCIVTWYGTEIRTGSDNFVWTSEYFIKAQTINGRIVAMYYDGNMDVVSLRWRDKNDLLVDLNNACAFNDLQKVQELLTEHPNLRQSHIITQAVAQAVRYKAIELSRYLIDTYKVDINKSVETSRMTGDRYNFRMFLAKTTIARLMKENGISL